MLQMRCSHSYTLNKKVFSLRLNMSSPTSYVWSSAGKLFHEHGPWTAKLRSPYLVLVRGTASRPESADRRCRQATVDVGWQYTWRYSGVTYFSGLVLCNRFSSYLVSVFHLFFYFSSCTVLFCIDLLLFSPHILVLVHGRSSRLHITFQFLSAHSDAALICTDFIVKNRVVHRWRMRFAYNSRWQYTAL